MEYWSFAMMAGFRPPDFAHEQRWLPMEQKLRRAGCPRRRPRPRLGVFSPGISEGSMDSFSVNTHSFVESVGLNTALSRTRTTTNKTSS